MTWLVPASRPEVVMLRSLLALAVSTLALLAPPARAQCGGWTPGFGSPAAGYSIFDSCMETFDAGAGRRLFVVGGNVVSSWNGATWEFAFAGSPPVSAFAGRGLVRVTLNGVQQLLLAGGTTGAGVGVSMWDGTTVTSLGTIPALAGFLDACVLDDGTRESVYVLGYSPVPQRSRVHRWTGTSWVQFGPDLPLSANAIAAFDDGSGPALHVALAYLEPIVSTVVRLSGGAWVPVGELKLRVSQLLAADLGSGPRLYVTIEDSAGPADVLHVLTNGVWRPVSGVFGSARLLERVDFGSGPELAFSGAALGSSITHVWSYDGHTSRQRTQTTGFNQNLTNLAFAPDPLAPRLYAFGNFFLVDGDYSPEFATFDGTRWSTLGRGFQNPVNAITAFDSGAGPRLCVAGEFITAGDAPPLAAFAQLGPLGWTSESAPFGLDMFALRVVDLGAGPRLFVGGRFPITSWDGTTWTTLLPGLNARVHALGEFTDGSGTSLVVGGDFTTAGALVVNRVAAWNGTSWSALGAGTDNAVRSFATYDEGAGERLFAGGEFATAGGSNASRVARWDGTSWSAVGGGIAGVSVNALCAFEGALYAGGAFTDASGVTVSNFARWDGNAWSDVPGGGANGAIAVLHVHDDGRGPALYAGGAFTAIGGVTANRLARFDGVSWEPVAGGFDGPVRALASFDDDADGADELFVGGNFRNTATVPSLNFARLEGCAHYTSFCAGDGSLADHTTPCPCGNDGAPGHGCASGFDARGALLEASGSTAQDTLVLTGSFMSSTALGVYLQNDAPADRVFHDGVLCAGGNLLRLRVRAASSGTSSFPDPSFPIDATTTLAQRGGVTPGSGATRYYSLFYRAPAATFCPPATANVTNGVRVIW